VIVTASEGAGEGDASAGFVAVAVGEDSGLGERAVASGRGGVLLLPVSVVVLGAVASSGVGDRLASLLLPAGAVVVLPRAPSSSGAGDDASVALGIRLEELSVPAVLLPDSEASPGAGLLLPHSTNTPFS
jgi:hypothetical protein